MNVPIKRPAVLLAVSLAMAVLTPPVLGDPPSADAPVAPLARAAQPIVGTFFGTAGVLGLGPEPLPYFAAVTFHSDGTAESVTSFDLAAPPGTPGRGAWSRIGDLKYSVVYVGSIIVSVTDTTPIGTYRIHGTVTTDEFGRSCSFELTLDHFDLAGAPMFSSLPIVGSKLPRVVPD